MPPRLDQIEPGKCYGKYTAYFRWIFGDAWPSYFISIYSSQDAITIFLTRPALNIAVNKINIELIRYHLSRVLVTIVWSLWRHRQSIVTSSAEHKASGTRDGVWRSSFLASFMEALCRVRNKIIYILLWQTVYALTRVFFCVYFPRCCATREINTKITLSWAHKHFAMRVQTLFYMFDQCFLRLCAYTVNLL